MSKMDLWHNGFHLSFLSPSDQVTDVWYLFLWKRFPGPKKRALTTPAASRVHWAVEVEQIWQECFARAFRQGVSSTPQAIHYRQVLDSAHSPGTEMLPDSPTALLARSMAATAFPVSCIRKISHHVYGASSAKWWLTAPVWTKLLLLLAFVARFLT